MSDNKITQDQLEPNVMEELESGIGDLSTLSTENKDSLVAAVTEIYGKNVIAEAIGEPLAVTDTFSEMGSEINSLLSSFKTNMMNSGVTVESGDKFKQLIEKIKGLTEGEGNKGIQFAEGSLPDVIFNDNDVREHVEYPMEYNIDFVPSILIIRAGKVTSTVGTSVSEYNVDAVAISNLNNSSTSTISVVFTDDYNAINFGTYYINENNNLMFYSPYGINNRRDSVILSEITYYAIGVGEEDTTLRDSLASILENKGVDVTEEDDMASLIGKVDSISGGLDIISATELPNIGKEGQICVITNNPVDNFEIRPDIYNINMDNNKISLYLSHTSSDDGLLGTLIPVEENNTTTYYFFNKVYQGGNRLVSYYYKDGSWKLLTTDKLRLLENGVQKATSVIGSLSIQRYYSQGDGYVMTNTGAYHATSFSEKIDFTPFTTLEIRAQGFTGTNSYLYAHATESAYDGTYSSVSTAPIAVHSTGFNTGNNTVTKKIDITSWTGMYYFTISDYIANNSNLIRIYNIFLY